MSTLRKCIALIPWLVVCPAFAEVENVFVDTWTAELNSKDAARAALAADRLGNLKEKAAPAIPALIKALADTPVPTIRLALCTKLFATMPPTHWSTSANRLCPPIDRTGAGKRQRPAVSHLEKPRTNRPASRKGHSQVESNCRRRCIRKRSLLRVRRLGQYPAPDPELVAFASSQLNDKSPGMRSLAIGLLGKSGKDAIPCIDQLIRLLADPDNRAEAISADAADLRAVRADAADTLGQIGPPAAAAVPRLTKMLTDDKEAVPRAAAAIAPIRIDEKNSSAAFGTLHEMLVDKTENSDENIAAASALAELGPQAKRALPALTKLLQHENEYVRLEAFDAIAEIGGKDAIPLLEITLKDKEEFVREWAQETIDELKGTPK